MERSSATWRLECAAPYGKTGDFICLDGTYSAEVCTLNEKAGSGIVQNSPLGLEKDVSTYGSVSDISWRFGVLRWFLHLWRNVYCTQCFLDLLQPRAGAADIRMAAKRARAAPSEGGAPLVYMKISLISLVSYQGKMPKCIDQE